MYISNTPFGFDGRVTVVSLAIGIVLKFSVVQLNPCGFKGAQFASKKINKVLKAMLI